MDGVLADWELLLCAGIVGAVLVRALRNGVLWISRDWW